MDLRVFCLSLLSACLSSQARHVETEPITELSCKANEGHDRVLDTNSSVMVMLGGFHKDNMDDCIISCCNQEWKQLTEEEDDIQGRCNLATFYEDDDHSKVNCFLSMCKTCVFGPAEGFHFAWVHPPAINYQQSQRDKLAMSKPNATSAIRNFILPLPPNPPPSQKESQSSILPSIPEIHLSPWQLISSAVSWYQSRDNAVKGRGKRQAGENVAEAPKAKVEEKQLTGDENGEASPTPSSTKKQTTPTMERQPSEQATSKPGGQSPPTTKPMDTLITTKKEDTIVITDNSISLPTSKTPSTVERAPAKTEVATPTTKTSTEANGVSITQKTTSAKSTKEVTASGSSNTPTKEAEVVTQSPTQRQSTKATEAPSSESRSPTTLKAGPTTLKADSTPTTEPTTTPMAPKEEPTSKAKTTTQQQSEETTSEAESTTKPATASSSTSTTESPSTPKKTTEAASVMSTTPQARESSSVTAVVNDKSSTTVAADGEQQTVGGGTTEVIESKSNETTTTSDIPAKANKIFTFQTNNFVLILSLALGIVLVVIVMITLSKRWYEAYQRRHYNKVDYLINGS